MSLKIPAFYGFDIETRPLPELVDRFAKPYPDFDESAVKYGNTKDPQKRADLLAAKRAEHEDGRIAYWQNLRDRAALDPFTGAVVCIGVISDEGQPEIIAEKTEDATLRQFWQLVSLNGNATSKFVFWSGCGDQAKKFDLDFIVTRSRINRIPIPPRVREGRFYSTRFVDLAGEFLLGQRDRYLKLTKAAEMLGLYQEHKDLFPKRDDDPVTGENFWQWWDGCIPDPQCGCTKDADSQRAMAEVYLKNDLRHLKYLAPHILG